MADINVITSASLKVSLEAAITLKLSAKFDVSQKVTVTGKSFFLFRFFVLFFLIHKLFPDYDGLAEFNCGIMYSKINP